MRPPNRPTHYVPRPKAPGSHRAVSFKQANILFVFNVLNVTGRSSRAAFWWPNVTLIALSLLFAGIEGAPEEPGILSQAFFALTVLPSLTLTARRFQDIGHSGWLALLAVPSFFPEFAMQNMYTSVVTLLCIGMVIGAACQPGINATNEFGPDVEAGFQ